MNLIITVDTSKQDQLLENVRKSIIEFGPRFIMEATPLIQQTMAQNVPVKTGKLRVSISSEINGSESVTSTNTGYGLFVDQPTKAHIIRPNISKFLRFSIVGQTIYARQVNHPGTPGAFFIQKTVDMISEGIVNIGKAVWNELMG